MLIEMLCSIAAVLDTKEEELLKIPGITKNTVCLIKLILPITRAYVNDKSNNALIVDDMNKAADYLAGRFLGLTTENVYLLCMDNKGRIIACPKLSEGDELCVSVSARTVVEQVIKTGATAVMLGHNHPKGFALPSGADISVTIDVVKALAHLGVALVDHIIVADDGEYVSMAASEKYSHIFSSKE